MIYVHICITLLTLSVALYLFSKVSQNNPSTIVRWIWYVAIASALAILVFQLSMGIVRVFGKCGKSECHNNCVFKCDSDSYHHGKSVGHKRILKDRSGRMHKAHGMKSMKHNCSDANCKKCKKEGTKKCCKWSSDVDYEIEEEITIDTLDDGKIIKKEIIIKKEKSN